MSGVPDLGAIISAMVRNVSAHRSSFVKMSARLIFPSMWFMVTNLLLTDSLMAFSRIVMWRKPLVVVVFDQHTHARLSL